LKLLIKYGSKTKLSKLQSMVAENQVNDTAINILLLGITFSGLIDSQGSTNRACVLIRGKDLVITPYTFLIQYTGASTGMAADLSSQSLQKCGTQSLFSALGISFRVSGFSQHRTRDQTSSLLCKMVTNIKEVNPYCPTICFDEPVTLQR
jgi:hypothetical protein